MLFSLTNPEVAILMMGVFLFAVLLGFPIAFTLMAMGIGFGYYAYYDPVLIQMIALQTSLIPCIVNKSPESGIIDFAI